MPSNREQQQRVYARLMAGFRGSEGMSVEDRWEWLMAAHIVGQLDFKLHVHSHSVMLLYAAQTRDWPEAAGQLFRLALVPLGHAIGRLPAGNIGRATVNAFSFSPAFSTASTSRPVMVMVSTMASMLASVARCSLSQESVNFIGKSLSARLHSPSS